MPTILKDVAWVRFIVMVIGIVITFTFTISTKSAEIRKLQDDSVETQKAISGIKQSQSSDHDETVRQGVLLDSLHEDMKEVKSDIKKLLQRTNN